MVAATLAMDPETENQVDRNQVEQEPEARSSIINDIYQRRFLHYGRDRQHPGLAQGRCFQCSVLKGSMWRYDISCQFAVPNEGQG